ncbi:sialidase-1 [Dysgonomonas hofstadii]|uniref:exo-alpha-sialidase n=1 Tax=Dysgonomonas hofstadii TaxID=637886 RepID=A0A840CVD6_9BACT|nr:sialidase family protein [Dysgonomonas hofstadii]MBB4037634.1 sialidase-1 [Dysgonomonas hofstadii]
MKRTNFLLFIVFPCSILLFSCADTIRKIQVNIEKPELPVLVKKDVNPVLKIDFVRLDSLPYSVEEIKISTEGTTDLSDISSISLYGTLENGQIDTSVQLCEPQQAAKTVKLRNEILADKDTFSLWVTVSLKDKVQLDHKINLACIDIKTSKGKLKFDIPMTSPSRIGVAVRQHNQDGVHTSRIPGLTISKNGTLLAIFDARYESSRDLQGHMDIALHRSTDKGVTWQPMQIVLDMGEWGGLPQKFNGVSDACILADDNSGDLYIAGLWMHGVLNAETGKWVSGLSEESKEWIHQWRKKGSQPGFGEKQTSQFLIAKSSDDGLTWSRPENITSKTKRKEWWLFAPAPGHGITLSDGTLVLPTQGRDSRGESFSNITWSKDKGKTWVTSNPAFSNTTECMAVELSDGSIMLNMRDSKNRGNKKTNGRRVAVTTDLGQTWKEHVTSHNALIEPTCMASIHRHRYKENSEEKSILLFVNPNDHSVRDKITLKVSFDDGMTWPEDKWILLDQYKSAGYSCITSVDENTIGILYESSQANLVFIQIPLSEILN